MTADERRVPGESLAYRFASTRRRIHEKAHRYFIFERFSKEDRNRFFGATDALFDTNIDASDFAEAFEAKPRSGILLCYGFLQALFVQQDAVRTLSNALSLCWLPWDDPNLARIRDIRNRLCGHPAKVGEKKRNERISSATISQPQITKHGFIGAIYFDDGFETIQVHVEEFLQANREGLLPQLLKVEDEMDKKEDAFRSERSQERFAGCFENGFPYLLQRLHCDLTDDDRRVQAETHAKMLKEVLINLREHLRANGFGDRGATPTIEVVSRGLHLLESILIGQDFSKNTQHEFDLLYSGLEKYIEELRNEVRELDEKLQSPI